MEVQRPDQLDAFARCVSKVANDNDAENKTESAGELGNDKVSTLRLVTESIILQIECAPC